MVRALQFYRSLYASGNTFSSFIPSTRSSLSQREYLARDHTHLKGNQHVFCPFLNRTLMDSLETADLVKPKVKLEVAEVSTDHTTQLGDRNSHGHGHQTNPLFQSEVRNHNSIV